MNGGQGKRGIPKARKQRFYGGIWWCLFGVLLAPFGAQAGPKDTFVRVCQFSVGHLNFCQVPYSGMAVVKQSGSLRLCSITIGRVSVCQGPYTGRTLVKTDLGFYEQCDITLGQIRFCHGPYTGKAVLQPEPQ